MWQDVLTYIERGRLSPARRLCQLILQDDPSWTDAQEILDQIQERFQQAPINLCGDGTGIGPAQSSRTECAAQRRRRNLP